MFPGLLGLLAASIVTLPPDVPTPRLCAALPAQGSDRRQGRQRAGAEELLVVHGLDRRSSRIAIAGRAVGHSWLLGGGDRKQALVDVRNAAAADADVFTHAEAEFPLWDMCLREHNLAE